MGSVGKTWTTVEPLPANTFTVVEGQTTGEPSEVDEKTLADAGVFAMTIHCLNCYSGHGFSGACSHQQSNKGLDGLSIFADFQMVKEVIINQVFVCPPCMSIVTFFIMTKLPRLLRFVVRNRQQLSYQETMRWLIKGAEARRMFSQHKLCLELELAVEEEAWKDMLEQGGFSKHSKATGTIPFYEPGEQVCTSPSSMQHMAQSEDKRLLQYGEHIIDCLTVFRYQNVLP